MKLDSKYFDRIRVRRKGERAAEPSTPVCQWDGCEKPGVHRAPVGRDAEGQYFLFCFEHAREYNKGYNYFSGLSDGEIARYQKEALTGHRPTWGMGVNRAAKSGPTQSKAALRVRQRAGADARSARFFQRIPEPTSRSGRARSNRWKPRRLTRSVWPQMRLLPRSRRVTRIWSKNTTPTPMAAIAVRRIVFEPLSRPINC
jgi:curved DNA-binding protein CbpA